MKDEIFEKAVEIKRSISNIEQRIIFGRGYMTDLKEYLENNPTIQINGVVFDSKKVLSIMPEDNYDDLIIKLKKEFSKL